MIFPYKFGRKKNCVNLFMGDVEISAIDLVFMLTLLQLTKVPFLYCRSYGSLM